MILFVVDVSPELGFGHLTRCLNLARMNRRKHEILFAFQREKEALSICRQNGFPVVSDLNEVDTDESPVTAVFDVCRVVPEYLKLIERLRQKKKPVLQITDLGLNILPVDTRIDGSLYSYPMPGEALHSGPDYMILHHKIRHFHSLRRHYRCQTKKIFVSLGGGVSYRELRRVVDILTRHGYSSRIAAGFTMKKNQKKILSRLYPGISWVGCTESLGRSFFQSDAALISPGVAAYEAAATGTPAIYLSHHPNQERTAVLFEEKGAGLNLGLIRHIESSNLIDSVKGLNLQVRISMGQSGKSLVDGLGLYRVNEILNAAVI